VSERDPEDTSSDQPDHVHVPTPISFKIMVVLATLYLLYRLGQGVVWLFQALSG